VPDAPDAPDAPERRVRLLFVCLGNICRSPTAEGVMRSLVEGEGLQDAFELDSAGTGAWHVGSPPDGSSWCGRRARACWSSCATGRAACAGRACLPPAGATHAEV
jgi:protein-tyrosine phosphatase